MEEKEVKKERGGDGEKKIKFILTKTDLCKSYREENVRNGKDVLESRGSLSRKTRESKSKRAKVKRVKEKDGLFPRQNYPVQKKKLPRCLVRFSAATSIGEPINTFSFYLFIA